MTKKLNNMSKNIAISLILSGFFVSLFGADSKEVKSAISKVTVYQQGAQVERNVSTSLPAGKSTIKLSELASSIDANSIQASAKGSFTILAVNQKYRSKEDSDYPIEITNLQDSIESIQFRIELGNNMISTLNEEKRMIQVNNKVDYSKLGFATEDLEDLSDFYRERIGDILDQISNEKRRNKVHQKKNQKLQQELQGLINEWNQRNGELYVDVYAEKQTDATFSVSYYVNNAGWYPTYNIKSNDISKPITLNYNAQVYQNTGVDWQNVRLTLSTTDPRLNNNKPFMAPWRIDFINPVRFDGYAIESNTRNINFKANDAMLAEDEVAGTAANFVQVNQQTTSVTFDIAIPYNIPSDGQYQTVNIQNLDLEAEFEYYAAPKLSEKAYLIAKVKNWEDKNLLPGEANIYLQNSYVGKSSINTSSTSNFLELSFGVDPQVVVDRLRIKDYCSTSFLGNNKKEQVGYRLKIRNTKNVPIKILVQDQIPVTGNEEISISVEDLSDGELNKDTGIVSWNATVLPASTKIFELKFEAKFPKDKAINL